MLPELARAIADRRQAVGWSINQLADVAGVAPNTVLRLLHGGPVQTATLLAVAGALGFTLTLGEPSAPLMHPRPPVRDRPRS